MFCWIGLTIVSFRGSLRCAVLSILFYRIQREREREAEYYHRLQNTHTQRERETITIGCLSYSTEYTHAQREREREKERKRERERDYYHRLFTREAISSLWRAVLSIRRLCHALLRCPHAVVSVARLFVYREV